MVATTATWAIPYAQSTDPFCDGPEITQAMAERIDSLLDTVDTALQLAQRPAYASISVTTPTNTQTTSYTVYYDTVNEDTANLVDLSVDSQVINQRITGIWFMGANIGSGTDGGDPANVMEVAVLANNNPLNVQEVQAFRENNGILQQSVLGTDINTTTGITDTVASYFFPQGTGIPAQFLVNVARMWVWRFSEIP